MTNQRTGEREERVLHLIKEGVCSEDNIMIVLEDGIDHDYCGAIGYSRKHFLLAMIQESII